MFSNFKNIEQRYKFLSEQIVKEEVIKNQNLYRKYAKELANIEPIIEKYKEYKKLESELLENEQLLKLEKDEDMKYFLQEAIEENKSDLKELKKELIELLIPKDEADDKNVIVEIRAGTGGQEASLFAGDLFRMYSRYVERKNWKIEILSSNPTDLGGFKEVIFAVKGKDVYANLKYESGVHRVQRVPVTESGGRIHTSTATVAVLPEVEPFEVEINEKDLRIDTYRSSGAGGQHVNKTDSAVRITHLPTGIVVSCQDERSQLQNREKAMRMLRAHLYELERQKREQEITQQRRSQVGTGERSEKIRTYNFPQNRVTDHRISKSVHNLQEVLDGNLDIFIKDLKIYDRERKLSQIS